MITLRRNEQRQHHNRSAWLTFRSGHMDDAFPGQFGALVRLGEYRLVERESIHDNSPPNAEIFTYVREGSLAFEDSTGASGILLSGEVQHRTIGRGVHHHETSASYTDEAHAFQLCLALSEREIEPGCEQKRFYVAERRGGFCVIASPNARRGSLHIHQDVVICSALLEVGRHVVYALSAGRSAWLHVVAGKGCLSDIHLMTGDGAGFTAERSVSFTAHKATELLLLDLG